MLLQLSVPIPISANPPRLDVIENSKLGNRMLMSPFRVLLVLFLSPLKETKSPSVLARSTLAGINLL